MIVNRRTFNVKSGHMQDAAQWIQSQIAAGQARGGFPGQTRVYVSSIGRFGQVAFEAEFESLAEYEAFWATWRALPTTAEVMKEWRTLTKPDGTNEIWDLIE